MTKKKTDTPRWTISTEVVHRGVTYSRGSAIPRTAKPEELARWEREGRIARLDDDGKPISRGRVRPTPKDEEWIRGSDYTIMRRLREYAAGPDRDRQIQETLTEAVKKRRSPTLVEALKLALAIPLSEADRHPSSVRKSA